MAREDHINPSERSLAYSDAIFAIVATIMILPLSGQAVQGVAGSKDLLAGLLQIWFKLLIYALAFILVSSTWDTHTRLFRHIEKVNETIVLLNLGVLMVVTFLPFAFLMIAEYPREPVAISMFCGCIAVVGIFKAAIVWQVYNRDNLLKDEEAETGNLSSKRRRALLMVMVKPILAVIAALVSIGSIETAWAFLILMMVEPALRQIGEAVYHCVRGKTRYGLKVIRPSRLVSETAETSRLSCFSDGVYSIVATLIILDICVNNVPTAAHVQMHGSVVKALSQDAPVFLSYVGTFVTVCLLWYLHHTMFRHIRAQNSIVLTCNKMALLFAGYLPIVFKLTGQFGKEVGTGNSSLAVQVNSVVVFLASVWLLAMWITASCKKSETLHSSAHTTMANMFMVAHLCIYPVTSLVIFCLCFFVPINSDVINWVQIGMLGVFILLKLIRNLAQKRLENGKAKISKDKNRQLSEIPANRESFRAMHEGAAATAYV
ncbi:TMEM175 [Branchiostoma lanceolatum]|uniref:Endosomal/lysosomal proton channel TMEM175 n=1 Tax=Branchiostoma lanceolatum TaxID=7740 RepID=A0A8K0EEY4_BRALA|nr:TMEM175 [Branchiostoma lanceolatum]